MLRREILNRRHPFRSFVYQHAHFSADKKTIEVAVRLWSKHIDLGVTRLVWLGKNERSNPFKNSSLCEKRQLFRM
jgi:hypothetical protein